MIKLRKRMIGNLKLRNFPESTITSYTRVVADFARFFHRSPDQLGPSEIRTYLLYAIEEKKISAVTYQGYRYRADGNSQSVGPCWSRAEVD